MTWPRLLVLMEKLIRMKNGAPGSTFSRSGRPRASAWTIYCDWLSKIFSLRGSTEPLLIDDDGAELPRRKQTVGHTLILSQIAHAWDVLRDARTRSAARQCPVTSHLG